MDLHKLTGFALSILLIFLGNGVIKAQTTISTDITSNTVWNQAGSPYTIANSITIHSGVILTIDSGVQVQFDNSVGINVDGTLQANGSSGDSIIFTSSASSPSPGIWNGFRGEGEFLLTYISTQYADTFIKGGNPNIQVTNSRFADHITGIATDSGLWTKRVSNSVFQNCQTGIIGESLVVDFCSFLNNQTGVLSRGVGMIEKSIFEGNGAGIKAIGATYVIDNMITANDTGWYQYANHPENFFVPVYESGNSVFGNQIGLSITLDTVWFSQLEFRENQICNNLNANALVTYTGTDTINYYLWDNCWCSTDSLAILSQIITNPNIQISINGFTSDCIEDKVYPGDTDYNQIANASDLLPIGIHFGKSGPVRPDANLLWIGQDAPGWMDSLANGVNIKHVDTDGNGHINDDDTLAIHLNYGKVHYSANKPLKSGGIPLYSPPLPATLNPGDSLAIPLFLGNMDTMAQNIYGLAFSLTYDSSMIKPGSVHLNFDSCWMGDKGVNLLTLQKDMFEAGQIDIALVRNDQQNVSGFGQIATIFVVLEDDISKKEIEFRMNINNEYLIDKDELAYPVSGQPIKGSISTSLESRLSKGLLKIYPQPAKDIINVEFQDLRAGKIWIKTISGKLLYEKFLISSEKGMSIEVRKIPTGIYILGVETNNGVVIRKIFIE